MRARAAPLGEPRHERLADLDRPGQDHARCHPLGCPRVQRRKHVLLELRAEPAYIAQALLQGGLAERLGRVDAELGCSRRARLGPRPGRRVIAIRPGGNLARSFSAAGIVPPSRSATIFSCSVLPMPESSLARPARASSATDTGASRTVFAAVR